MIISDINFVEVVAEAQVEGGTYIAPPTRYYSEYDYVSVNFNTTNAFQTIVYSPAPVYGNSAAAGAKGDAYAMPGTAYTYSKADTLAVAYQLGSSFSTSTSAAVVTPLGWY